MPAPAKYAPPHKQLLRLAADAKARGVPFDEWWAHATPGRVCPVCATETLQPQCPRPTGEDKTCGAKTRGPAPPTVTSPNPPPGAVLWPNDAVDRRLELAATDEAREAWRRAYEDGPQPRRERALPYLMTVLDKFASDAEPGDPEAAAARGNDPQLAVA